MAESATYTFAQLRAFEWLPEDGTERKETPEHEHALWSLLARESTSGMIRQRILSPAGPSLGSRLAYYLTPSGIAERKRLVEMGEIK